MSKKKTFAFCSELKGLSLIFYIIEMTTNIKSFIYVYIINIITNGNRKVPIRVHQFIFLIIYPNSFSGIVFTKGVGVEIDMERGIKYYEKAVMNDDDLARFNLAEIFSSGMNGVEVNYKRAYKLYRACGLPYAHFRLGEYFEYGTGVGVDIAMSQKYYRLAAEEGYEPAREKLQ